MSEIINALDRALDVMILLYHEKREMGVTEISKELGYTDSRPMWYNQGTE